MKNSPRIKDLPSSERPIERLIKNGPGSLSMAELLAILIGSGIKGENAYNVAEKILSEYTSKDLINIHFSELMSLKGIGKTKASRIIAGIELTKRLQSYKEDTPVYINSSEHAFNLVINDLKDSTKEALVAIFLTRNNRLINYVKIGQGGISSITVKTKDILVEALKSDAEKIILVHNHPSGDLTPSKEDIEFTKNLIKQCEVIHIPLIDHIIVGSKGYKSTM
ncbi:MAG: RadC family protein [Thermoplasmata archaeon]